MLSTPSTLFHSWWVQGWWRVSNGSHVESAWLGSCRIIRRQMRFLKAGEDADEREREWGLSSQSRAKIMMFTTWWCWRLYITSCSSASALLWQSKDLTQPRPKAKTTMTSRPFCPNALRQSQGGWQGGSQQLQGAVNLKDSIECLAVCSYLTWVTMVFEWCQKGNLFRTDSKIGSNSWIQLNPIQENFSCLMWNPFLGLQVFEQAHVTLEPRWDSGCHISLVRGKPLQNDPSVRYNDIAFATVFVQCQYQYHHVKSFKLDWISRWWLSCRLCLDRRKNYTFGLKLGYGSTVMKVSQESEL